RHTAPATLLAENGTATSTDADAPLVEPEVRRSANGELRTTLHVRYAYKDIGGHRLHLRTYDGLLPGPTLRCQPGDRLRLRLVNELPPNGDVKPLNLSVPHQFMDMPAGRHGSTSVRTASQARTGFIRRHLDRFPRGFPHSELAHIRHGVRIARAAA